MSSSHRLWLWVTRRRPERNEPFNRANMVQQWLYGFILYFVSLPVLALQIYSIYNPEKAYLLFRRNLKYRGDVQLSEFYLDLSRYGSVFGLVMYSLIVILTGYGIVLVLALASLALLYRAWS